MPKVDLARLPRVARTSYPPPHDAAVRGRSWVEIGEAVGFTAFGANLATLEAGAWSSQRHWHSAEDELVIVVSGVVVLVEEGAETELRAGDIATFRAGVANGHHLQNRSGAVATFLAIGPDYPEVDVCTYPDIGMVLDRHGYRFTG
jgi:uncharacterized cupin superfamily protein